MNAIKVLDCTLRDGGRILNCNFGVDAIKQIALGLDNSHIDIIEIGFLRSGIVYQEGTTFFTDIYQAEKLMPVKATAQYVVFTDFGMFDYFSLPEASTTRIRGIRFGFKHGEFEAALPAMLHVKELGYDLYIQSVNSLSYSDAEMCQLINAVNKIQPKAFAIVDTYGAMYSEDLQQIYSLVDKSLDRSIALAFHSHNNYQLSFSLAQQIIKLNENCPPRELIIDATLLGIGKGAGNLSSELLVEYLNRKKQKNYDFNTILDTIDEQIYKLSQKYTWGYSVPALMSGVYKAHPNNVIYLTEKYKLSTKDIVNILAELDANTRLSYDYDAIEKAYLKYFGYFPNEQEFDLKSLYKSFNGKDVLVIAPGKSIANYKKRIEHFIEKYSPIVITVNFEWEPFRNTYIFWNNQKRYNHFQKKNENASVILTSNMQQKTGQELIIPYSKVIEPICKHFENATMMVLRMLKMLDIKSLTIAGLDGFGDKLEENYIASAKFENTRMLQKYEEINHDIEIMLRKYIDDINLKYSVSFLTPSRFELCLRKKEINFLVLDVDGTLTDGAIQIGADGEISKCFNVKDGYGLVKIKKAGIEPIIITGRNSKIVKSRAEELGISKVFQGVEDKYLVLNELLKQSGVFWENIAYMGDDLNDLVCIENAGISACPSDAVQEVCQAVTYKCECSGGKGAVREFCEELLRKYSVYQSKGEK